VRRLRRGTGPGLFVLPPVLGLPWCYGRLAHRLDMSVHGLQTVGRGSDAIRTFPELAAACFAEMQAVQSRGPYHLLGWSLGGVLAHAVAEHAETAGSEVALLGLLDSFPPGTVTARIEEGPELYATVLRAIDPRVPPGRVRTRADLIAGLGEADDLVGVDGDLGAADLADGAVRNFLLAQRHRPGTVRGDTQLFRAGVRPPGADLPPIAVAWRPHLAGSVEEQVLPAGHHDLMSDPAALDLVATELNRLLMPSGTHTGVR
jgi:thioesterase domain-containing protein